MHEALAYAAYERDTEVADEPVSIARPRTSTEDLEMQVYVNGRWHRRMPDLAETACGQHIDGQFANVRRRELVGDLCPECHTAKELVKTATNNRKDYAP